MANCEMWKMSLQNWIKLTMMRMQAVILESAERDLKDLRSSSETNVL